MGFTLPAPNDPHRASTRPSIRRNSGSIIFTYRDERRLFALIGIIIAAALLRFVADRRATQRIGEPDSTFANSLFGVAETASPQRLGGTRALGDAASLALPSLERENAALRARNRRLTEENARLHELAAAYAAESSVVPVVDLYHGIEARVIGFPPENESRAVTIDKGFRAGVRATTGVLAAGGMVGRVVAVGPFSSTVLLATDYTSRIPAIVRRGRWWGIARGNLSSVVVEYSAAGRALARRRRRGNR